MDEYRVKITSQAKEHLHLIKNYISLEIKEPETAKKMLALLKENMKKLSFMPYRVKCMDEQPWRELGFRKIRVKNYFTFGLRKKQRLFISFLLFTQEWIKIDN